MTVEITCKCGSRVPFIFQDGVKLPISATCDECNRTWQLNARVVHKPEQVQEE